MAKREITFSNGEIYHLVLRSVEGITIFRDETDYYRGIFGLYEFNNTQPVNIWKRRRERKEQVGLGRTSPKLFDRERLVDIFAFCLMPNHIHLLVRQIKENGVTNFMRKFATGYAMYFNKKYERKGHLFQGRFLAVHIKDDVQLSVVFVYIHSNPLSLIFPKYKEEGIDNVQKAMSFLEEYKWSSFQDYIGKKNFPSIIQKGFIQKIFPNSLQIKEDILAWLEHKKELKNLQALSLE